MANRKKAETVSEAQLLVPMPRRLKESIDAAAAAEGISMSAWARRILDQAIAETPEREIRAA